MIIAISVTVMIVPVIFSYPKNSNLVLTFWGRIDVWQDSDTSLIWQRKIDDKEYIWNEAFEYAKKLNSQNYGNINNWRVSTREELKTLLTEEENKNRKGNRWEC